MKIALAIERFDPQASAIERTAHQTAVHLIAAGHQVAVITGEAPPALTLPGGDIVNGHTVDFRHRVSIAGFARWAPAALAQQQADVTLSLTLNCPADFVLPLAGVLMERIRRETAAGLRAQPTRSRAALNLLNLPHNAALKRERTVIAHPLVRRFIAPSSAIASQLAEHHRVPASKITPLTPGVDFTPPGADEQTRLRRRVRTGFHVADDAVALLFLAHDQARLKGILPLLHAGKMLIEQGRLVTLLLAGHIPYRDQLAVTKLGLRDQARMIGPTNEFAALLCAADITVMPAHHDPADLLLMQSLMTGIPVVTSIHHGTADTLAAEAHRNAFRVIDDPQDTPALADAIAAFLAPSSREAAAATADHWRQFFAIQPRIERLLTILQSKT